MQPLLPAALVDRAAIRAIFDDYAAGVDARDWARFRRCFGETVEVDLSSWNGAPAARVPAEDWVLGVRSGLSGFDATQHLMANHLIETSDDRARATVDIQASHRLGDEQVTLGGWYATSLIRTNGRWRIDTHTLDVTWRHGDEALFARAATRNSEPASPGRP